MKKLIIPTNTQLTYFIQLLSGIITQCKFVYEQKIKNFVYLLYKLVIKLWVLGGTYIICVLVKK